MIELLKTHSFFVTKTIESCTLLENQGYCNENYLVVADGIQYIVRKLLRDDIDRAFEWKVQNLAYKQGITAEPLVFDEENGFMVFAFLEGEHKSLEVETSVPPKVKSQSIGGITPQGIHYDKVSISKDDLKNLATTLRKLHTIKIDAKPIELHIKNKTDEVLKAFKTIDKYPKNYVLCHNDLNPQNIFFTDEVKFIDWEYAGVNDRYFDLASICVEFGLDTNMQGMFLKFYFEYDDFTVEKLEAYKVVYMVLCEEWLHNNL